MDTITRAYFMLAVLLAVLALLLIYVINDYREGKMNQKADRGNWWVN